MTNFRRRVKHLPAFHFQTRCAAQLLCTFLLVLTVVHPARAQAPAAIVAPESTQVLPAVVVSGTHIGTSPFDTPASVDVISGTSMREGRQQVNLSESLGGVPGLLIQNRQNYAQDLQISVRGFGARSTFGIRGLRLYVDGIPATMPDGQGQSSNIDIGSIDRVEILRGPFSALHGNSSGGVIEIFTEEGSGPPVVTTSFAAGSDGLFRFGVKAAGASPGPVTAAGDQGVVDYLLSASRFTTAGYRDHSAARKNLANAKLGIDLGDDSKITFIANSVDLKAQDPQGITFSQFLADPRSVTPGAVQFNTRKTVQQTQGGVVFERKIDSVNALRLMTYYGQRQTVQFQSIPIAAQASPLHAGGVIVLGRDYGGVDARWTSRLSLAGLPATLVGGLAFETLTEQRQGFQNFAGAGTAQQVGVQGALRRDETNHVWNADPYLQASVSLAERWTLDAGARYSDVRFKSDDHYVVGANADDSGVARYKKLLPIAALHYRPQPALNLYVAAGRGFETPTLNELSYRSDGASGLNFGLRPAINTSLEFGAKVRTGDGMLTAAVFQTRTEDEIVSAASANGRATFQNAGRTLRNGMELSWEGALRRDWRAQLAYTLLDARYKDSFCSGVCGSANPPVAAGNHIPGIARQVAFAALAWAPPQGWRAGLEGRYLSQIYSNDSNADFAPAYFSAATHAGYRLLVQGWAVNAFARIDNLFDRRYVGSAIINDANGRYFEPAPGRNWSAGLSAAYRF
ncbi:TonB-dependent receptor [soil metagenome]